MDAIVYDKVSKESDKLATLLLGTYPQETISDADIASFDDGADDIPVKSMSVAIEPKQDLHGYDHPWPAGGGKNILPISMDNESSVEGGVTVTVVRDTDGNAIGINLNGTCTNSTTVYITGTTAEQGVVEPRTITLKPGKYYLLLADGGAGAAVRGAGNWEGWKAVDSGSSVPPVIKEVTEDSPTEYTTGSIAIYLFSGNKYSNATIKPMICSVSDVTTVDSKGNTVIDYTFSPYSNICPITGYTGCRISRCGYNLFDGVTEKYSTNNSGKDIPGITANSTDFIPISFNSLQIDPTYKDNIVFPLSSGIRLIKYDANKAFIGRELRSTKTSLERVWDVINCAYVKVQWFSGEAEDVAIKKVGDPDGNTGASYPISWETEAGTVYGGMMDVANSMLIEQYKTVLLDGTGSWSIHPLIASWFSISDIIPDAYINNGSANFALSDSYKQMSSSNAAELQNGCFAYGNRGTSAVRRLAIKDERFATVEEFTTYLSEHPVQIVYRLAVPILHQLTPQQITTLLRTNNIWSNIGKISLTYRVDPGRYLVNTINRMITDNEVIAS